LQEERDLINKHLAEQKRKQDELLQTELGLKEKRLLVRNTLNNLQVSGVCACFLAGCVNFLSISELYHEMCDV